MYWLIESKEQLDNFDKLGYKEAFIEPIGIDHVKNPVENEISFIYIHPLLSKKGYIISINHSESLSLNKKDVLNILKKYKVLYTIDKKNTLHYLMLTNLWDIMIPPNHSFDVPHTLLYDSFYRINHNEDNLNYIFPLTKHYEYLDALYSVIKDKCVVSQTKYAKFYNNKVSLVFAYIENSGIEVNKKLFAKYFREKVGDRVYTKYNTKTTTTRPSNSFGGINYAALNKTNGCRSSFISSGPNNMLVEIDFTAYHPSIIAKLLKYDFGGKNIHKYFAELYEVDYEKSKQITFQQIYGNIFPQYKHLEFFKRLTEFRDNTWKTFNEQGYFECPISGYVFIKDNLENMNPSKLLNYILQNLETSNNVNILWDIIKIMKGYKSKIILYTYDSFLFDFDKRDKNLMGEIYNIIKNHGFQFKVNWGENYDFKNRENTSISNDV